MTDPILEIERFAIDRMINQMTPDYLEYATSIVEELIEGFGGNVPKENRPRLRSAVAQFILEDVMSDRRIVDEIKDITVDDQIDSIQDISVFSITETMKYEYDPRIALLQAAKEINSRAGSIVDGKFEKFLPGDIEYKETYKADYSKAKL